MIIKNRFTQHCALWAALTCLGGCTGPTVELDSPAHTAMLEKDRGFAEQAQAEQTITLTLDQAMQRGIESNLDARVAAMEILVSQGNVTLEKIKALPNMTASASYSGRDNDGATSSRSVLSGLQSLEPSQSSDRDRKSKALELNWNLLDIALAYADTKKANEAVRVARERHEKVIQNIERDVYGAYWRAYAHQTTRDRTRDLISATAGQIDNVNLAVSKKLISADVAGDQVSMLNDRVRTLKELDDRMSLSEIELKSMLALPLNSTLVLKAPVGRGQEYKALLSENLQTQEWEALKARPEVREEILQKNITLRDTKREVLATLPGAELFVGKNYDSNSFLQDSTWISSSAKLVQSILNIITLPERFQAAEQKQHLADARRQALVAAVLAQTSIARERLISRDSAYQDATRSQKAAQSKASLVGHKKQVGFVSGQSALQARLEHQIENLRQEFARAEVQDAYAAYMNTLGRRFFRPLDLTKAIGGAS
jgi:outer membrane protein TolC